MTFSWLLKTYLLRKKFRNQNKHNEMRLHCVADLSNIKVGKKSYGSLNIVDSGIDKTQLIIGSYCSISDDVQFLLSGEHNLSTISTFPFKVKCFREIKEAGAKGNIIVKDDVWIGSNAIICSGVTIEQGAVIAAGAVVTKDVPPYAIVGGNPAKIIKYRISEKCIEKLLKIDIVKLLDNVSEKNINLFYTDITDENIDNILKSMETK